MTTTTQTTHPSASIYVGDLNNDVSEGLLFEIFKRVGTVNSIRVCRDSVTKRSLGYAYVNFVNYDDARRAIDTLNNTSIKGRACRIMWSTRDPSSRKSGVGNIFIRGLDESIGPKELHDTFSQFGNIISCKVVSYPNGKSKGYGYVHFENQSNAEQAIKIVHGRRMGENVVYVTPFIPRSERQKRIEQTWTNVFVKNLDINYTEQDLRNLFGKYGEVDSCILLKKENIDAKYGFVNFKNHQDAVVAVEKLNNSQVGDKVIICCRAQKKTERQSELRKLYEIKRRERIHKYQGLNVYVKNIEDHVTEDKLRKEFEQYGNIINLTIMVNESTGASKGFGFVCYSTPEEAQKAIAEIGKNKILPGCTKPLYVAIHEPREVRQQRFTRNRNPKIQQPIYPSQPGPVFYNQGYPPMMRGPNQWPQGNPQFSGNFVQGQRGGRGGARGGGRGGGNMGKTRIEMSELQSLPLNRQKDLLGEQLFKRIEDKEPSLASKITGMIIHSQDFSVGSVVEIINDEEKLDSIIRDAKSFLEQNQQPEGDVNETN